MQNEKNRMKKKLMQSYGDFGLIPRNIANSSSTCVDNSLDYGQNEVLTSFSV